jgi:hypothetical protein
MTQMYAQDLEAQLRARPTQWFMFHAVFGGGAGGMEDRLRSRIHREQRRDVPAVAGAAARRWVRDGQCES